MRKTELNISNFEQIPLSIICDILSRLSIKTCLICKLVCKEWYYLIISPEFANHRSNFSAYFTILLYGKLNNGKKNFLLLDLHKSTTNIDDMGNLNIDNIDHMIKFKSKFKASHNNLYVVNECNGLICLKSWEQWSPYIVCNLLTGQQVVIEQNCKPFCSVEVYGLGQCRVSNHYKVVRILNFNGSCKYMAEIQTLGTNEWRTVGDSPQFQLRRGGAFLNGSLHRYSYRDNCIWSFDFGDELFSHFCIPDCSKREVYNEVSVFDSQLCFSLMSRSCRQCEIWVMKEYGVNDSWVKQFVFPVESFAYRMPLLEMQGGKILVSYNNCVHLGVCDVESGRCRRVRVPGISSYKVMAFNARFSKF